MLSADDHFELVEVDQVLHAIVYGDLVVCAARRRASCYASSSRVYVQASCRIVWVLRSHANRLYLDRACVPIVLMVVSVVLEPLHDCADAVYYYHCSMFTLTLFYYRWIPLLEPTRC